MEIELDMQDLNEIKRNYEGIAGYLTSHFSSFCGIRFCFTNNYGRGR